MMEEPVGYLGQPTNRSFQLLRQVTGHGSRISIERIYIEAMDGDLAGGLFVSQVVFWSQHTRRKDGWFYRSADEWLEKDYLTRYQVDKYTAICVAAGWLQTKLVKANGAPTRHYLVDQDAFMVWLAEKTDLRKFTNPSAKNGNSVDLRKFTNPKHTPTDTKENGGLSPRELTALTDALLFATGLKAIVDAGDDYKLRDAQDAAILMAKIGYASVEAVEELVARWKTANAWRNTLPSLRNLKEFASQSLATQNEHGSNAWAEYGSGIPDYTQEA